MAQPASRIMEPIMLTRCTKSLKPCKGPTKVSKFQSANSFRGTRLEFKLLNQKCFQLPCPKIVKRFSQAEWSGKSIKLTTYSQVEKNLSLRFQTVFFIAAHVKKCEWGPDLTRTLTVFDGRLNIPKHQGLVGPAWQGSRMAHTKLQKVQGLSLAHDLFLDFYIVGLQWMFVEPWRYQLVLLPHYLVSHILPYKRHQS